MKVKAKEYLQSLIYNLKLPHIFMGKSNRMLFISMLPIAINTISYVEN
jgi:hypothetical protein